MPQRSASEFGDGEANHGERRLDAGSAAEFAVAIRVFPGKHLGQRGHDLSVQLMHLVVEPSDIERPLGLEDRHCMINVAFFLGGNRGEGVAQAARRDLSYALVAGDGEGLEHDLLNNETADKVPRVDPAKERAAEALPILGVYVVRHRDAQLFALGGEGGGMSPFALRMFEDVGYFFGILRDLGQRGVVQNSD